MNWLYVVRIFERCELSASAISSFVEGCELPTSAMSKYFSFIQTFEFTADCCWDFFHPSVYLFIWSILNRDFDACAMSETEPTFHPVALLLRATQYWSSCLEAYMIAETSIGMIAVSTLFVLRYQKISVRVVIFAIALALNHILSRNREKSVLVRWIVPRPSITSSAFIWY